MQLSRVGVSMTEEKARRIRLGNRMVLKPGSLAIYGCPGSVAGGGGPGTDGPSTLCRYLRGCR
jgi:hypothetical protein